MNIDNIICLNKFGIGAELTTVKIQENRVSDCKNKCIIDSWDEAKECWRTASGMRIPSDGRGFYAMHSRETPNFYYSANPEHIKERNKRVEESKKKRMLADEADKRNLELLREDLEELLRRYGASISAEQLSGDDQGVEVGLSISIGKNYISI